MKVQIFPETLFSREKRITMKIAIDFDGTIVVHSYPEIGPEVPGAVKWMKRFQEAGAQLILFTMRDKETLAEAVEWCRFKGIEFYGINTDPKQKEWTSSPKAYAELYIDDTAFGCPLIDSPYETERQMVDWSVVGPEVLRLIFCMQVSV